MTLLGSVQTTSLLVVLIAKEKQKKKERREQDMAIYHLEAKVVSRGTGRSAGAASAYLSCSRLYNDYDGIQHDYTRKQGLVRADKHPKSTRYGRQNPISERWNSEEQLATWADVSKRCLERAGREERKALVAEKADAGAEAFRKDIATMEAGLKKLETQEQKYSVELDKALTEYADLKAQAADFDPMELYAARQAIRPTQEKAAERQLKDSNSMQEKPSLVMLLNAKQESSRLLGEDAEERQVRQMTMRRRSTEQLKRPQLKKDRRKIER